jgi:hypothetical protein
MSVRRRIKQFTSLNDRLVAFAKDAREKPEQLPPSVERDNLLRKARETDNASHLGEWIHSHGLQSLR